MDSAERREFRGYCRELTNAQLEQVVVKEAEFKNVDEYRRECYEIAVTEAEYRGLR